MYILVLYVFNRNFDKCLHLFKSYDRLLSVIDLSDIVLRPIGPTTHWSDDPSVLRPIGPTNH